MSMNLFITLLITAVLTVCFCILLSSGAQKKALYKLSIIIVTVFLFCWVHRSQWYAFYSDAPFHLSLLAAAARDKLFVFMVLSLSLAFTLLLCKIGMLKRLLVS